MPAELFSAVLQAKEVYDTAETQDEKAQGYGEAAGSLAGTLAGAAAGAAIGSVVPIIGTALGGMIGGYLGSMGGGALGGYTGQALFGSSDLAKAQPITPMLMAPRPGPEVPSLAKFADAYASTGADGVTRNGSGGSVMAELMKKPDPQSPALSLLTPAKTESAVAQPAKLEQTNTFSPVIQITVQGDAKDPQQLANQLMPEIQRLLDDRAQQTARRSMSDESHA